MKEYKVPVQSLIDHIKTATDVDPWAKEMAEELLKQHIKAQVIFRQHDGYVKTECGNCGYQLDKAYSRCPKCQMYLDWNEGQK